jgi:hypothetical protein
MQSLSSGFPAEERKSLFLVQSVPDGQDGRLGAVGHVELGEDGADVVAHSALGEVQPGGDVVALSLLSTSPRSLVLEVRPQAGGASRPLGLVNLKAGVPRTLELTGLLPDTAYIYTVSGSGLPPQETAFHTRRAPGVDFTFTIDADPHYSDPRFDGKLYAAALDAARACGPDFHVDLGDTFMTEKAMPRSSREAEGAFAAMHPYLGRVGRQAGLFLVNGNHEGELGWLLNGGQKDLPVWCTRLRQQYYPGPRPGSGIYSGSCAADPLLGEPRDGY